MLFSSFRRYRKKKDKREKINIIKEKNSGQFEASNEKLKNFLTPGVVYNTDINSIIKISDTSYLTADNNEFHIYELDDEKKEKYIYKSEFKNNRKYEKFIFSSEKIIFIESEEEKNFFLKIYTNNTYYSCQIKNNKCFDIFESDDVIMLIMEQSIELLKFDPENLSNPLYKISEIRVEDQILTIEKANTFLFCGHKSGLISIWSAIPDKPFLKNIKTFKIHFDSINKIICDTEKEKDKIILITCSSDKTLKVHSLENQDRICINLNNYTDEVMDIKVMHSFDKNDYYIISLKNGIIKILDSSFKDIDEIPIKHKTQKTRIALGIENKEKDAKGDWILIAEGEKLDKYHWIHDKDKKKSFQLK